MVDTPGGRAPTDSGEFQGYASAAMLARYHQEQKLTNERVSKLEYRMENIHERLNNGSATMTRHGDRIDALEDGRRPKWQTIIAAATVLLPWIISTVWMAARYPDSEKFDRLQQQVNEVLRKQEVMADRLDRALVPKP